MTKQIFLTDFEKFVKEKIKSDFDNNKYLDFTLDFKTLLEDYLKNSFNNEFFISQLVTKIIDIIFLDDYELIVRLEKFNTEYYNISRKFDSLIYEIDEQNLWTVELLNSIIIKIDKCKNNVIR